MVFLKSLEKLNAADAAVIIIVGHKRVVRADILSYNVTVYRFKLL